MLRAVDVLRRCALLPESSIRSTVQLTQLLLQGRHIHRTSGVVHEAFRRCRLQRTVLSQTEIEVR